MKLHLSNADGLNTFTAYGDNYVDVNGQRHTANVVVLPEQLLPEWTAARFETLSEVDLSTCNGLNFAARSTRSWSSASRLR